MTRHTDLGAGINLIGPRVLILRDEAEKMTKGGIMLPEVSKEAPRTGLVLEVGTGLRWPDGTVTPCPVKKGDRVLLQRHGGIEVDYQGNECVIVEEPTILGVLKDEPLADEDWPDPPAIENTPVPLEAPI